MNLESLPNEILLHLFDCLDGIDLLHAFYGLNSRFNLLLYKQFRAYRFNFYSISKGKFDIICQQHLPFITDRVISLSLCDDSKTPEQTNLFFSYIPSLAQFTHLRFLTLPSLSSSEILMKIVNEFHHLNNLTHLELDYFKHEKDTEDYQLIVNNIWSLTKLTHCRLDIHIGIRNKFRLPTKISTSLKDLYISRFKLNYNQIHKLLDYTPHLKRLSIFIDFGTIEDYKPSPLPTLIDLDIFVDYIRGTSKMILFLQNVPNLHRLKVNLSSNLINGYQWEQVIQNYLPKLKVFKLTTEGEGPMNQSIQEADELLNSFRSSFWIDEHKWFIRCAVYNTTIHVETLSKIFNPVYSKLPDWLKSTYPYDDHEKLYNTMDSMFCDMFDKPLPSYLHLENIMYLDIKLPIPDNFWSVIPSLKQLETLAVTCYDDSFQSQLQVLLDRAPHLHNLRIYENSLALLQTSLFKYTNTSVRQLNFQLLDYQFNEEECVALTRLPLGVQCEELFITVKNHENILILIENMINLKALHVGCENGDSIKVLLTMGLYVYFNEKRRKRDDIIQWLKDRLPSTCFISKDSNSLGCIHIWTK